MKANMSKQIDGYWNLGIFYAYQNRHKFPAWDYIKGPDGGGLVTTDEDVAKRTIEELSMEEVEVPDDLKCVCTRFFRNYKERT